MVADSRAAAAVNSDRSRSHRRRLGAPFHPPEPCHVANHPVQTQDDQQKCLGMYSKKSWGGPIDPFIEVKFVDTDKNKEIKDPTVSVIVWEWKDSPLLGKQLGDEVGRIASRPSHEPG